MKSLIARQKTRLPAALASLNNGHSFDLRACCVGMRSLSMPNLVPIRPLHLRSATWWSSFVSNLSSTMPGRILAAEVEAHVVAGYYCMAVTTIVRNLIWPCNNFMLSCYTSSFSISPSLVSKPMKRKLSLCSSCFIVSTKVSTARLTT